MVDRLPIADWYEQQALALTNRVADLEAERDMYRRMLQAALDVAADLTAARERDRARYVALCDELRQLRGDERRAA